ncbi:hypothetical protein Tco_0775241 [Tanacetum coccineum]
MEKESLEKSLFFREAIEWARRKRARGGRGGGCGDSDETVKKENEWTEDFYRLLYYNDWFNKLCTIEEEVYVRQPPGFVDPEFPDKSASTTMETHKPLSKDADGTDVDVHLYRFQVQPKSSHLHAAKRIFRYLKNQPTLGL